MTEELSKGERKELRRLQRPALILALTLLIGITAVNLVIYYHDIVTGIEGLARPPISQLIIIEIAAGIIAFITFYYLSKKTLKDLSASKKQIDHLRINFKYAKKDNGSLNYLLKLKNSLEVKVDSQLYKTVAVGDIIEVAYAPQSSHVFEVKKLLNKV